MTLDWRIGGLALGFVFFLAVMLVKPIGVSTQFVIFDAAIGDIFNPSLIETTEAGTTSSNAYLAKSGGKYAKSAANPFNYSFVFVIAMAVGAGLSARLRGGFSASERRVNALWASTQGPSPAKRYLAAFLGGFIVLYGARLAGGCTSGHMMSGMMQTAVSGYLFALGAFATAIPTAILTYGRRG